MATVPIGQVWKGWRVKAPQATGKSRPAKSFLIPALALGAALIGLSAADLFLAVTSPLAGEAEGARRSNGPQIQADTSILARANPFAGAPETAPARAEPAELPVTNLRLKLKGVYVADDGSSSALVETPGGVQQVFREEEEIIRGVRLRRVEPYRVVINRNGILESLLLDNRPEPTGELSEAPVPPPPAGGDAADEAAPAGSDGMPDLATIAGARMPLLRAQGLQGTDVPVAINGEPLSGEAGNLQGLFLRLRQEGSLTLTVRRSDELVDVTLAIPDGAANL